MDIIARLSIGSTISLYILLAAIALFTLLVIRAQAGCIRGKFFSNPDGTRDDWRQQKIFYGIAWADLVLACPTSLVALVLIFTVPPRGFFFLFPATFYYLSPILIIH